MIILIIIVIHGIIILSKKKEDGEAMNALNQFLEDFRVLFPKAVIFCEPTGESDREITFFHNAKLDKLNEADECYFAQMNKNLEQAGYEHWFVDMGAKIEEDKERRGESNA